MTVYTVLFRGVGLMELDKNGVREVLFPNAEPGVEPGDEWDLPGGTCQHPDGSTAHPHFARAVSVSGAPLGINPVLKDRWIRGGAGANGSRIDASDQSQYAAIAPVLASARYGISLLGESARKQPGRVATRFTLHGGDFRVVKAAETPWYLSDLQTLASSPKNFALWTAWTISLESDLQLQVMDLAGNPVETLVLTSANPMVCFANYENDKPTWQMLEKPTRPYKAGTIDHDFKWLYRMFDVVSPSGTRWKDVLGTDKLVAPVARAGYGPLDDMKIQSTADGERAPTVSTCFPGIWMTA